MSTRNLLLCLGTIFLFEAAAPVSAALPSTDRAVTGVAIAGANDATTATASVRPKKKAKKARKRGGKKGCEAYNS